jgi:hypothetical protein
MRRSSCASARRRGTRIKLLPEGTDLPPVRDRRAKGVLDVEWVPERPVALGVASLVGALLAGPVLGNGLASWLAPGSHVAQVAGFAAFPLAFALGMVSWLGLGVAAVVVTALRQLVRGRLPQAPPDAAERLAVPPGHAAFVVWSASLATLAGVVVGLASSASVVGAVAVFAAAGLAYGIALRALARHGYLPFPEPG